MIDRGLQSILVCPVSHAPLSLADGQLVERINRAIAAGRVRNRAGQPIDHPIGGGLVRDDNELLYPIQDDIPVLLASEAIALAQID